MLPPLLYNQKGGGSIFIFTPTHTGNNVKQCLTITVKT